MVPVPLLRRGALALACARLRRVLDVVLELFLERVDGHAVDLADGLAGVVKDLVQAGDGGAGDLDAVVLDVVAQCVHREDNVLVVVLDAALLLLLQVRVKDHFPVFPPMSNIDFGLNLKTSSLACGNAWSE